LLVLAGVEAFTLAGESVQVPPERRLDRLALMAPATDFFRTPGSLQDVRTPIAVWAGTRDEVTPAATAEWLKETLRGTVPVDVRIVADAGHFSFMSTPPPHATEPLVDRDAFLDRLAQDIVRFVTN